MSHINIQLAEIKALLIKIRHKKNQKYIFLKISPLLILS